MTRLTDWRGALLESAPNLEVAEGVLSAIQQLLEVDAELLRGDLHEQAITGSLACHLRPCFHGWHIDCEYNRDGHEAKKSGGLIVKPDIIIHRRRTSENLLVIEVKKSNNPEPDDEDLQKLHDYREPPLRYDIGLFLKFGVGDCEDRVQRIQWV